MYTSTFNPEHILLQNNVLHLGNNSNIRIGIDFRTIMNGECGSVMWIALQ
jgi:hypothetical protein